MRAIRQVFSLLFVLGLFTAIFAGTPWYVVAADDPVVPWWLRIAVFCLLGGILGVLVTVALEQRGIKPGGAGAEAGEMDGSVLLLNSDAVPGRATRFAI